VSGHSTFSAAAATVLDSFFGSSFSFSTSSQTLSGVTRSYTGFDQAAAEAGESRIYAGIHFEFSNQDGQAAGKALANYALSFFNIAQDTTPPKVALDKVLPSGASNHNFTLTGQVTDNLSGPGSLTLQIDQGNVQIISFDGSGHFSIPTNFALDGSADGTHTLSLVARDFAGNASAPVVFSFILSTHAPTISLTSPANGGTLASGATLTGAVTTSGAAITALSYAFDGGAIMPITFDATGAFNATLDLSKLSTGSHTLTVTAQDAAGNSTSSTLHVSLPAAVPLMISDVSPQNGATDVGSTYRPKVTFSRPINKTSLNGNNFYATDTTGTKLPANIVVSDDGTFAWLFFTNPMPGGSTVTVTVDGSTIQAADGALLDAADTGTPGSKSTFSFSTVSLASLPGTSLYGTVADPGPDLKPESFDDVRPGADGVLMTADDVYLNPIAGVKVFIIGQEGQAVYTDAQGHFNLLSVPAGDVKLVLEGPTATNAPAGYYFPEMDMDLTIQPAVANTVMGSMGTLDQQAASGSAPGVYLPRIATSVLQTVNSSTGAEIGVSAVAAPNLTPQQQQELKIDVAAGSLVGPDGQKMASAQIGISTVPPQLVMDMLPAGVMQHTFDITIQAPGVATFSTPAAMTFPNVFNAPPGTKQDFLSFDHTTGRLVIEGTATVSADGKFVTTDPGTGITHPGWHGLVAPGSTLGGTGCDGMDVPQGNPQLKVIAPGENPDSNALYFAKENDTLQLTIENTGGGVLEVTPTLSGDAGQYFKVDNVDSCSESGKITIKAINPNNWKQLKGPAVYAATLTIATNGGTKNITLVRLLDAGDTSSDGSELEINSTEVGSTRDLPIDIKGDAASSISFDGLAGAFSRSSDGINFQPTETRLYYIPDVEILVNNELAGSFEVNGVGVSVQQYHLDANGFVTAFGALLGQQLPALQAFQSQYPNTAAINALFSKVLTDVKSIFAGGGFGSQIMIDSATGAGADPQYATNYIGCGDMPACPNILGCTTVDFPQATWYSELELFLDGPETRGQALFQFRELFNDTPGKSIQISAPALAGLASQYTNSNDLAQEMALVLSHEFLHSLGDYHSTVNPNDVLAPYLPGTSGGFVTMMSKSLAALGLHVDLTTSATESIYDYYKNLGVLDGILPVQAISLAEPRPVIGLNGTTLLDSFQLSFGTSTVGSQNSTQTLSISNSGEADLVLSNVRNAGPFSIDPPISSGLVIPAGSSVNYTITFAPTENGPASGQIWFATNDPLEPFVAVGLNGTGQDANAHLEASAAALNFGAAHPGGLNGTARTLTIQNTGLEDLQINSLAIGLGSTAYTLVNPPQTPFVLATGVSTDIQVSFSPDAAGLVPGELLIESNDPDAPVTAVHLIGTGLDPSGTPIRLAGDYVAAQANGGLVLHGRLDAGANFQFFFAPNSHVTVVLFDPSSGLVSHASLTTGPSGNPINLGELAFRPSTAPDSNGDGLPDDAKFAIGIDPNKPAVGGISDLTRVLEGLDPLSTHDFPTGVIASLPLQGQAKAVVAQGSITSSNGQTLYVATGTYGLAIVNASQFNKPVVLGQLQLPGKSVDVGFDPLHNLAVLAAGSPGLHLVDVSNPAQPTLQKTVALPGGAQSVKVFDGQPTSPAAAAWSASISSRARSCKLLVWETARSPAWRGREPRFTA
jgi:hypothetical protein